MIRSAVTISLVPEARGGPFVFWDDLEAGCRKAAELGFDGVEIFAPGSETFQGEVVADVLARYNLGLAAVGTGAGWVKHRLSLTGADSAGRKSAIAFVRSMIDAGARFAAPAIVGSMQGRWGGDVSEDAARQHLRDALDELGEHARRHGVPVLYEPLNRYETNLNNSVLQGAELSRYAGGQNVKVLADLFHMNIEDDDPSDSIRQLGGVLGHVHLADSNRRPAGCGHTDFGPIAAALRGISYGGYVSAECLPYPDSETAARKTIHAFNHFFRD
jgi:sugar phosphate isomerase/epimerase